MPSERVVSNRVTVIGRRMPSNYEISVNGDIESVDAEPIKDTTVVS
jgi:hypothetical protein